MRWFASANRLVAVVFIARGVVFGVVGLYLGLFGWVNDGLAAGLGILTVGGAFGAAFVASGLCFRVIARAHDAGSPRRWWLRAPLPTA